MQKNKLKYNQKKHTKSAKNNINEGEATIVHVKHMQENEALMLMRGGNIARRRVIIGDEEAGSRIFINSQNVVP